MDLDQFLSSITTLWRKQFEHARQRKHEQFGKTADRLWGFLSKSYRELYIEVTDPNAEVSFLDGQGPFYKCRLAKSQEFVALMLPYIHAKVPHRLVEPRRPQLPVELAGLAGQGYQVIQQQDQLRSWMLLWWLNYLASDAGYGLFRESRTAIPEALVKGRGIVWQALTQGPHGLVPASYFDTVDDFFIDPDARQLRDAGFIIRRRREQVWRVADRFGIEPQKLRAGGQTDGHRAALETQEIASGKRDEQGDVYEWLEIWSRIGVGDRLLGWPDELRDVARSLEAVGPHVYLAIGPGIDHPLNLPPSAFQGTADELIARLQWPLAVFEDLNNPWPCCVLDFYPNAMDPWAKSPLEGGLALQIFLDHLYSFAMGRVRATTRTLYLVSSSLPPEVKKALVSGLDQEVLELAGKPGEELAKLIEVLEFPPVNKDLWQVAQMVERQFEAATGMLPLLYGGEPAKQMRSSLEAQHREEHLSSRPDDFAQCVEHWQSAIAAKEGQISRLYVDGATIAPLFGELPPGEFEGPDGQPMEIPPGPLTTQWMTLVNTDDPKEACAELSYTVEAGSGRRKNKQKQLADAQQFGQTLLQPFMEMALQGMPGPYNALMQFIADASDLRPDLAQQLLWPEGLGPPQPTQGAPKK